MKEKLGYSPSERGRPKQRFLRIISRQFPLEENPEFSLAASILSRMRGATFEEKRDVFLYWIWREDPQQPHVFGLRENDVLESIKAVLESPLSEFMYDTLENLVETWSQKGQARLPLVFNIKSVYFRSLLENEYLKRVTPDGKPLPYKTIAFQMSRDLKKPVTQNMVENHVLRMQTDGRAKRRYKRRKIDSWGKN